MSAKDNPNTPDPINPNPAAPATAEGKKPAPRRKAPADTAKTADDGTPPPSGVKVKRKVVAAPAGLNPSAEAAQAEAKAAEEAAKKAAAEAKAKAKAEAEAEAAAKKAAEEAKATAEAKAAEEAAKGPITGTCAACGSNLHQGDKTCPLCGLDPLTAGMLGGGRQKVKGRNCPDVTCHLHAPGSLPEGEACPEHELRCGNPSCRDGGHPTIAPRTATACPKCGRRFNWGIDDPPPPPPKDGGKGVLPPVGPTGPAEPPKGEEPKGKDQEPPPPPKSPEDKGNQDKPKGFPWWWLLLIAALLVAIGLLLGRGCQSRPSPVPPPPVATCDQAPAPAPAPPAMAPAPAPAEKPMAPPHRNSGHRNSRKKGELKVFIYCGDKPCK